MKDHFETLLVSSPKPGKKKEQEIQDYMEINTEFLPTPDLLGHGLHFNIVISKFPLGDRYKVDYAYLTKNSDSWRIVFVELELPSKTLFLKNIKNIQNTADFNSALAQIQNWKEFLLQNQDQVIDRLRPLLKPLEYNPIHFHYVLIIGRSHEKDN